MLKQIIIGVFVVLMVLTLLKNYLVAQVGNRWSTCTHVLIYISNFNKTSL